MKHSTLLFYLTIVLISLTSTHQSLSSSGEKTALIFGITGQDGSYLAELLLEKGYVVHGVKRRTSGLNTARIDHLYNEVNERDPRNQKLILHYGDITDTSNVLQLVEEIKPQEIYNLAAQSHVRISFDLPEYTADCDALGTLRILEAMRLSGLSKTTKFYQASTSELYGKVLETPQTESTPFYPRSPYGVAKLYAFYITKNYRESYGMFACNGILFNHESPRRGENFVTRKITQAVANIYYGLQDTLYLGNLDSKRDWGYAKDYVEAMWLMLQQDEPEDFVIATGETHSVREFIELAFGHVGITVEWRGQGVDEVGLDKKTGREIIRIDPVYFRPAEVDLLLGNPSYAYQKLGWKANTPFKELVAIMMDHDLAYTQSKL